jgi:hypothetical protein
MSLKTAVTVTVLLLAVAVGFFTMLYPVWPEYFTRRAMFHRWVGASRTGWDRTLYLYDDFGTHVYYDDQLNLMVVVVQDKKRVFYSVGESIHVRAPYRDATATQATFQVGDHLVTVPSSDHNALLILTATGESHTFVLAPGEASELMRKLYDDMAETKRSVPLLLFLRSSECHDSAKLRSVIPAIIRQYHLPER